MYRAKIGFSGLISMNKGQEREIEDKAIVEDLLKAGYIEEIKPAEETKPAKKETAKKETAKK
jgi:hypothetical protein